MAVRSGQAVWRGDLKGGSGNVEFGSFSSAYSFSSRFEEGGGTNPEELIAAAHAGCYSMALSNILATAGFTPTSVATTAKVHLEVGDDGAAITKIELTCTAAVPAISEAAFLEHANAAKVGCPVSKALSATPITLDVSLSSA